MSDQHLAEHIAHLTASELPLASGLQAAAAETNDRRLRTSLLQVANALTAGSDLTTVLEDPRLRVPEYVKRMLATAATGPDMAGVLTELLAHQQLRADLRRRVTSAMAYPALLVSCAFVLFALFHIFVGPQFVRIFADFEVAMPRPTLLILWITNEAIWPLLGFVGVVLFVSLLFRVCWPVAFQRIVATVPLFGPLSTWLSVAQWSQVLATLADQTVPLPEALRLSASALDNANMRKASLLLVRHVESGSSLSEALVRSRHFPAAIVPLIRWGEQTGAMPDALRTCSELFAERVRTREGLLKPLLPPVVFIGLAVIVIVHVEAILTPLYLDIQSWMAWGGSIWNF